VVDLALYKTNVLVSKPPPVGLSTNPRLTCLLFSLPFLSICATHKPTLNSCTRFRAHGVGPSRSSIQDRYSIPTPPLHRCKVRWRAITDCPNAKHNLAQIVRTALSARHCDEDLMGEVPRLWNCLQAAAMESQPRYTDYLETLLTNPPRGSGGVLLRAPRYGSDVIGGKIKRLESRD
jgi:hypothetical protein